MSDEDDLDRIMAVMAVAFDPAFGEAWTRRQVDDALVMGNCHYLLAGTDGNEPEPGAQTVGFSLSRCGYDEEELLLFAVHPEFRGRGIGRRLLSRFAAKAKERGAKRLLLEMRKGNPAEALYTEHGFAPIGERPNYYRGANGQRADAITFAAPCK
jgi:[ribosomal protein S18]-alanine N-acetyltransferase